MKNGEKYKDKIKNYDGTDFCRDFVKPIILKSNSCSDIDCQQCRLNQILWLDEEREEPEVDWSKVEVDTPILVREHDYNEWQRRYFAEYRNGRFFTWLDGRTSWNAKGCTNSWKQAKLAEDESC